MEQLVHLRLKSIYKAFAAHRSSNNSTGGGGGSEPPSDPVAVLQAMAAAAAPRIEGESAGTNSTMTCHSAAQRRSTTTHGATSSAASSSSCAGEDDTDEQSRPPLLHEYQQAKAKADAAAAALLAELEEEEEAERSKKTKKKKKKARQQRKKTVDLPPAPPNNAQPDAELMCQPIVEDEEDDDEADDTGESTTNAAAPVEVSTDSAPSPPPDPMAAELEELIEEDDVEGLEDFLASIKGVPGKAMLRKHAKKAIKRLREPPTPPEEEAPLSPVPETSALLRIVTETSKGKTNRGAFECVLEIAPIIVGWIIGKGGQRIRDLMEDSGARIWIDQDCDADAARTVYVSGQRNQVDTAVGMLRELVDRAPATPSARPTPDGSASSWLVHQPGKAAPAMPEASVDDGGAKKHVQSQQQPLQVNLKPRLGDRGAQEDRCKHILTCEARFVPLLIGRRGWTIKSMQDTTGAKVDIDQNVLPRQITITGNKKSVEEALEMVLDVLSYPHAQPLPDDKVKEHTEAVVSSKAKQRPTVPVAKSAPPLPPSSKPDPQPVSPPEVQKRTVAITPTQQNGREVVGVYSPPSSLIMTSDVKSTISASSSLSSTPEPSLSRVRPTATGPRMTLPSPQANREALTGHNNLIAPRPHSAAVSMPSHSSPLGCRPGVPPSSPAAAAPFLRESEGFGAGGQPFPASLPLQQHPQSLLPTRSQPIANYGGGLPPSFMTQSTPPFPAAAPPHAVGPGANSSTVPLHNDMMLQGQSSLWNGGDLSSRPDSRPQGDAAAAQERDDAQLVDNLFGKSDFLLNGLVSGLSLGGSGLWSQENGPDGMFSREGAPHQQQAQPQHHGQQPASRFAWSEHGGN